ncbi:MAG: hypothetical protein OEY00_05510 [Gammaproteobacteria bacterium]|nr:hypothetical protein [Gammaproteobacteria bacterium]
MIRIGNEINTALNALDRQVQMAKNTAGLAVIQDKKDKPNATDAAAEASDEAAAAEVTEVEEGESAVGNNLDVEA